MLGGNSTYCRAAIFVAGAALLLATACANAQPVNTGPINSIDTLARDIRAQFAARYSKGTVGNDWCFNVHTEPGYSYWYYDLGSGLQAKQIRYTARIQATYLDGFTRYASVFLGLQIDNPGIPQSRSVPNREFDLNSTRPAFKAAAPISGATAGTTSTPSSTTVVPATTFDMLTIPDTSGGKSLCQNFGQFLQAYVLPSDLNVANVAITRDTASFAKGSTDDYDTAARWWMFSGRGHEVFNITSYGIILSYQDPVTHNQINTPVSLVVGFGGGAGP